MDTMQAVLIDPAAPARLAIKTAPVPIPTPAQALVKVSAFSLNAGEVRGAKTKAEGSPIGWDVAGTVAKAAADGSGPKEGARVVGFIGTGNGWAEYAAVPTNALAKLPTIVTFEQASTLPAAGLTAYHALAKGGLLLGKSVLVTGASGGVGLFTIQLARHAGAVVTASVRTQEKEQLVRDAGATQVAVGEDLAGAEQYGPFDLVLDSVGGKGLGQALGMLKKNSVCVVFGTSAGAEVTFNASKFYGTGRVTLVGLRVLDDIDLEAASIGLHRLAGFVADGRLKPYIEVTASWTEVGVTAQKLVDRKISGKAVLTIS